MTSSIVKSVIIAAVAFIVVGIAMNFAPTMLTGFEALRTNTSAGNYTALTTVVGFGPTLIVLGFVVFVGIVGFMGMKKLF